MYIDFEEVKRTHTLESVMGRLNLKLKKNGNQYRGACPVCGGNERGLALTPGKGWYCFTAEQGGDVIGLVQHIRGLSAKEAAQWLTGSEEKSAEAPESAGRGFRPLEYLEHDHEAVLALGFDPEDAKRLGVGYAKRGVLRGTVALPIRLEDGTLSGYVGITDAKLPPRWTF